MPRVSVILPVHNRAHSVGAAIDSVLAQEMPDFELIAVDDGSSDGSAAVIEGIRDPRVRLIQLERNRGGNAARNAGIRSAQSELLAFLDSDDSFLPDKLGFVAAEFAQRPKLDVLVDSYRIHYADERPDQMRLNPAVEGEAFIEALFQRRLWKATPAISARREAVLRAGLFDEELRRRQDFEFLARISRSAHCAASAQVTWVKCWSEVAISAQPQKFIEATMTLCRKHPEYVADSRFYHGLARDLARQLARLGREGQWSDVARDLRLMQREFGAAETLRLLRIGWREGNDRKRAKLEAKRAAAPPRSGEAARAE